MKKGAQGAARRYAHAVLDVAAQQKADAGLVQKELASAAAAFTGNGELRRVLEHPAMPLERRRKVAHAVFAPTEAVVTRVLDLLLDRGRIGLLPEISLVFTRLWNEQRGVLPAEAVTAVPLDTKQVEALGQALADASGKEVALQARVDPAVLGGVVVHMGGRTYDGSVRARLQALRERLSAPGAGA